MNGYNSLLMAVQRALDASSVFYRVATSENLMANSERGSIHTLKGRSLLGIEDAANEHMGKDGVSVTNVVINEEGTLIISYSDESEDKFDLFNLDNGATIHHYHYEDGVLIEYTDRDLDQDGNIIEYDDTLPQADRNGRIAAEFAADDGTSVTNMKVQTDGSFNITYSDGDVVTDIGNIDGMIAAPIDKVEIVDDYLYFTVDGNTVEATSRDENGDPVRVPLTGADGLETPAFYPDTERDSLKLLKPEDHNFGDEYFLELYDKFSADQPKLYGPLNKTLRILEDDDIIKIRENNREFTITYPNGSPVIIKDIDGVDGDDSLDVDPANFDGEYITGVDFDEDTMKLGIHTNIGFDTWLLDVPKEKLPSGAGSITGKNTPSPRIPAIIYVTIADEANSITLPISLGRVVGRDGYDGFNSELNIDGGILKLTETVLNGSNTKDLLDLNYYLPEEMGIDPTNDNKFRIKFSNGEEIFTEETTDGADGKVPRIDYSTWDIGSASDNYTLSFSMVDSDLTKDFNNFMQLRPVKGFNVSFDSGTSELVFDFKQTDGHDRLPVTLGKDGTLFTAEPKLNSGRIELEIDGTKLSTDNPIASMQSIEYSHDDKEINITYTDGAVFNIAYERGTDGSHGDILTNITENVENNSQTFTYGDKTLVVNDLHTDKWITGIEKTGETYTVSYNHTDVDDEFNISGIDGENMTTITDVTVDKGRYKVKYSDDVEDTIFIRNEVKWIVEWRVNDANKLEVKYSDSPAFIEELSLPNFNKHMLDYTYFVSNDGIKKETDGTVTITTNESPDGYKITDSEGNNLVVDGSAGYILEDIDINTTDSTVTFKDGAGEVIGEVHNIERFNGIDAVSITDITTTTGTTENAYDEVIKVSYTNGDSKEFVISNLNGNNAYYPINGTIRVNGDIFTFDMSDGTELDLEVPDFQGISRWINDMWVTDGKLMVDWSDKGNTEIGKVDGDDAMYPLSIRQDAGDIVIQTNKVTDDTVYGKIEDLNANDGNWLTGMSINENRELVLDWVDNTDKTTNLGMIDGIDAKFPVELNEESDDFEWVDAQGDVHPIGTLDGFNGQDAKLISRFRTDADLNLIVEYSDGDDKNLNFVNGIDANYLEVWEENEGTFTTKLKNDSAEYDIGTVTNFHAPDGKWWTTIHERYVLEDKDGTEHYSFDDVHYDLSANVTHYSFSEVNTRMTRFYIAVTATDEHEFIGKMDAGNLKYPTGYDIDYKNNLYIQYNDDEYIKIGQISDLNGKNASYISKAESINGLLDINNDLYGADIPKDEYEIKANVTHNSSEIVTTDGFSLHNILYITLNTHEVLVGNIDGSSTTKFITNIRTVGDDLIVDMSDGSEEYYGTYTFVGEDGDWPNAAWYSTNETRKNSYGQDIDVRILEIPYGNDNKDDIYKVGEFDGRDFENEIGEIKIDTDGFIVSNSIQNQETKSTRVVKREINGSEIVNDNLFITTNYEQPIEAGYNAGEDFPDGRTIDEISIDYAAKELKVLYSDAVDHVSVGVFDRVDFGMATIDVNEGAVANGELLIKLSDDTRFDLGRIKGSAISVDVVDALVNIEGNLVLTRNDNRPTLTADDVVGKPGVGIASGSLDSGDLIFTLDDGKVINAGFVQRDLGFAPFNFTREYNRGESATTDGRIYVALNNELTEVPSMDSSAWAIVRFEDDPSPDAGRPDVIEPKDLEVFANNRPFLLGGRLRNYYSIDYRGERIFAVDLIDGNFSAPVYEATENNDGHQVEMNLEEGKQYKWRMRDVVANTGYITDWSLEGTFTVIANSISLPIVDVAAGLDKLSMNIDAGFTASAFSDTAGATHVKSLWQIKDDADDNIIVSEEVDTNLTSFLTPFAYLEENKSYSVRVKYYTADNESAFSDWFTFNTKQYFDFNFKPTIEYVGENINATVARPEFKSVTALPRFYDDYMEQDDVEVFWEVYNSKDELVWSDNNRTFVKNVRVGEQLLSKELHKIRVKYDSERLKGHSEWSDYVEFTPDWNIAAPAISNTSNTPLELFFDTAFHIGDRTPANVVIDFSEITVTDGLMFSQTDQTMKIDLNGRIIEIKSDFSTVGELATHIEGFSQIKSAVYENDVLTITPMSVLLDYTIDVPELTINAINGVVDTTVSGSDDDTASVTTVSSSLSYTVSGTTATKELIDMVAKGSVTNNVATVGEIWKEANYNDIYVSHDWEIRRQDDNRLVYGKFADFEKEVDWDVQFNEEDSMQEYYAHARVNGLYGSSDWSAPFFFKMQEIVFTNIYYGTSTGYVARIDNSGSGVWSTQVTTSTIISVVVNDNREAFAASGDNKLYKLDDAGEVLWSYDGHTNNVNSVSYFDTDFIATASSDTTVHMINSITGDNVWINEDHTSTVNDVIIDLHGDVITASSDNTIKKLDFKTGEMVWEFKGHTNNVNIIKVDNNGNIYSRSSDNTIRKVNPRGYEEWSVSKSSVTDLGVDIDGIVYYTNTSGNVHKLNPDDGSEIGNITTLLTTTATAVEVDDNLSTFVSSTSEVVMADPDWEETWRYNNPYGNINDIALNRQPVIVKPAGLRGRFYELKAPINLVAF